jgi:hypothetical protein
MPNTPQGLPYPVATDPLAAGAAAIEALARAVDAASLRLKKTTAKVVNTTNAPVDLLNNEIILPAGALGTARALRLSAHGDWKQNSGGPNDVPRFQLALGGTILLDTGAPFGVQLPNVATRYGWWIDAVIAEVNGATNQQSCSLKGHVTHGLIAQVAGIVFAVGEGTYTCWPSGTVPGAYAAFEGWNAGAKDATAALALALNVVNPSAAAGYEVVLKDAQIVIE